jgi:putative NIF3 family GTP cyclohydrolase 1 type 2
LVAACRHHGESFEGETWRQVRPEQVADRLAPAIQLPIRLVERAADDHHVRQSGAPGRRARLVGNALPATASGVRVAGDYDRTIETVALCAGAGDSLLSHPEVLAADVYVTSDLRHHPASEAVENARIGGGPALIDVSHWASEWLWLDVAAEQLREALPGVEIVVSELRSDPWDFAILQ